MVRKTVILLAAGALVLAGAMVATAQYFGGFGNLLESFKGADAPDPGPLPAIKLVDAFPKLRFDLPLWFGHDGTSSGWLYVCEQDGTIWRFKKEGESKEEFLNLKDRMASRRARNNEEGLLALAFHPKHAENRYFYVCYSMLAAGGKPRRDVLARFTADNEGKATDLGTEKIILEVEEPYGNHNGCSLLFGKDGFLYASFGDGGSANDPHGNGQNLSTLLASVIRIDVDQESAGKAYSIPKDNPFVDRKDARGEIWAFGLRNVWRMAFDAETGLLWGGDVGQNSYEEIDVIERGGNYGWNKREGLHDFKGGERAEGMIDPVAEYGRDKGVSVTGGCVYRGKMFEKLQGLYIYGDYQSGRIWGLQYDAKEKKVKQQELLAHIPGASISSFGQDPQGEIYVCGHYRGTITRIEIAD